MEAEKDGEVNVTFPEQYTEELAGKDATFKVKIHAVRGAPAPRARRRVREAKSSASSTPSTSTRPTSGPRPSSARPRGAENNFRDEVINKAVDNMTRHRARRA